MQVKGKVASVLNKAFGEKVDVDVIERIHEDFDRAGEELLEKAQEILDESAKVTRDDVNRKLVEFGFEKVEEIKAYQEVQKALGSAESVKDKLAYYKKHYPDNVFVSLTQARDICKKYGLVLGSTKQFIGEIPDKNKLEIMEFKIRKEDDNAEMSDARVIEAVGKGSPVMIVASKNEFDMSNMYVDEDWELKELPKDPIVLYPVHGGYLVVSKWGKEEDLDELK